jgi:hypothetical protein
MKRKTVNLRDQQEVLALMKILYGNNEVKDDTQISDSNRESRAKSIGEVVESAPVAERVLLQE